MAKGSGLSRRTLLATTGAIAAGLAAVRTSRLASAATYPTHDITWLIYQRAGGGLDLTTRAIQPFLRAAGVATRIEYLSGAGGRIARTRLFTAEPSGYLMMTDATPSPALGEFVFEGAYKTNQFEPIFGWNNESWVLCVKKDSPIRELKDLIALSKQRPIRAATIGRGDGSHLQLVILKKSMNVNMSIAHFDGSAAAFPALFGGHVDVAMVGPGGGQRNSDNLHFLAVFREGGEPITLPNVPTAKALGYDVPSIDQVWYATTTPAVPKDRVEFLRQAFDKALSEENLVTMRKQSGHPGMTRLPPDKLAALLEASNRLVLQYKDDLKD